MRLGEALAGQRGDARLGGGAHPALSLLSATVGLEPLEGVPQVTRERSCPGALPVLREHLTSSISLQRAQTPLCLSFPEQWPGWGLFQQDREAGDGPGGARASWQPRSWCWARLRGRSILLTGDVCL